MSSAIVQTVPLGARWPTLDPFLFCAHHLDRYPAGDGALAPAGSLAGRSIGADFAGIDGWNMYHGSTVPGFPQHPHRGFETITYVRRGWCDHSDSLGAQARFGEGDVQWVTAGAGIVHSEMFPLFDTEGPNTLHLFQIWLNLPAASKMVDPYFSMLWHGDIPVVTDGGAEVTVIAGSLGSGHGAESSPGAPKRSRRGSAGGGARGGGLRPQHPVEAPPPPPDSWAAADSDVAIWHIRLDGDGSWTLPPAADGTSRVLYLFEGSTTVDGRELGVDTGVVVDPTVPVELRGGAGGSEALLLQGRPIGEPVAQYGPFVLNDEAGIRQAVLDYQRTGFGGWPWPTDDPVHGPDPERFARYGDGTIVRPDVTVRPDRRAATPSTG